MRPYELLSLPPVLAHNIRVNTLVQFVAKLLHDADLDEFFLTYELTLFLYNCVRNADVCAHVDDARSCVCVLYEKLFPDRAPLDDVARAKIAQDIAYAVRHRAYTVIRWPHYAAVTAYGFFFRPTVFLVDRE